MRRIYCGAGPLCKPGETMQDKKQPVNLPRGKSPSGALERCGRYSF